LLELHLDTDGLRIAAARREIVHRLQEVGSSDSDFGAAELIIGELLANVSRHAPGPFVVRVGLRSGYAYLEVIDGGQGFTLPTAPRNPMEASGHGLHLVRSLARKLDVRHVPGQGTTVYAELPVAAGR
jgi:anti-sigma regulatory factor (Ser/Thr protein kinase)